MKKEKIIITKEQLKQMLELAHCDGKHGFDCNIEDYMVILK